MVGRAGLGARDTRRCRRPHRVRATCAAIRGCRLRCEQSVWRCHENPCQVTLPLQLIDIENAPLNGATFVSSYSGCGGLDMGFRLAGFAQCGPTTWTLSRSRATRQRSATMRRQETSKSALWPERGSADLVVGGPPCQGFSVAGKMNPADPRSEHVDRFLDLVAHVSPAGFVMENVKALAVSERWTKARAQLVKRAGSLGYDTSLMLLRAAEFGVAQRRERVFFVGLRCGAPPKRPEPTTPVSLTVRDAFGQIPRFGEKGNDTRCKAEITPAKRPILRSSAYQEVSCLNGNGRPLLLESTAPTLPASMGGNATPIVDQTGSRLVRNRGSSPTIGD